MPKRIIVVDDDPTISMIITRRLVANGYVVLPASSGADLMAKLPAFKPDAILLDVMMPGMDGVQVAEVLGQRPNTASLPIVFLSALISPDHLQDSPTNLLHHYLGKPFEPDVLLNLLKRIGI
jgi:CheY-like chemotaxis protein